MDGDPHFMIELPEREDALCFNIDDTPGTILNLVRDPQSGELLDRDVLCQEDMYCSIETVKVSLTKQTFFNCFCLNVSFP